MPAVDLDALWREHRRFVAAVLVAHGPRESELEDLLQDVATRVVENAAALRDPDRARAWLRSIALNVAASAGRKSSVRRRAFADSTTAPAPEEAVDPRTHADARAAAASDAASRVLEFARGLPVEYREPLLLKCLEGLSQRAIADALDLPETTIETRLVRARAMLRAEVEKHEVALPIRVAERSRP